MRTTSTLALLSLFGIALAGCTSAPKVAEAGAGVEAAAQGQPEQYATITATHAPFYEFGPAQASRPDGILKKGVLVKYISKESGFSQVQLVDVGQVGYVANDYLADAPAPPPPAPDVLFIDTSDLVLNLPEGEQAPVDQPSFRLGTSPEESAPDSAAQPPLPSIQFR